MPFVKRDSGGKVVAIYREKGDGAEEYLPPSNPAILGFIRQFGDTDRPDMLASDLELIRVFEDLTDLLIGKNVVRLTDFPAPAQEKLMRRKRLRSSLSPITELLAGTGEEEEPKLP
jgi:hypothetical protein